MIANAEWKQGKLFEGHTESGHTILFDGEASHSAGPSPMEMVLAALCGCTSFDVVAILQKKREPLTGLTVSATAEQAAAPPRVFTRIRLTYLIRGKVSHKAAEDAVNLSSTKYCSVSKMLDRAAEIEFVIEYDDADEKVATDNLDNAVDQADGAAQA